MEYLWLAITAISLIAGIHKTYLLGLQESYVFFLFSIIAFLMYKLRLHLKKQQNDTDGDS